MNSADPVVIDMYGRMMIALEILESCPEFSWLIPEVRSNMVYARPDAETPADVMAIDGRITFVGGRPHAAGRPAFGASSHMARFLLELRRTDNSVRAGIDFANNDEFAAWLKAYCEKRNWTFSMIDRSREPVEVQQAECGSMPWKVGEAVRAAGGRVPKICYENGAIGKEPVSVITGSDPITVAEELTAIAREYIREKGPQWVR